MSSAAFPVSGCMAFDERLCHRGRRPRVPAAGGRVRRSLLAAARRGALRGVANPGRPLVARPPLPSAPGRAGAQLHLGGRRARRHLGLRARGLRPVAARGRPDGPPAAPAAGADLGRPSRTPACGRRPWRDPTPASTSAPPRPSTATCAFSTPRRATPTRPPATPCRSRRTASPTSSTCAGPSLTVDTACSSSLVALDAAVGALRAGRADARGRGGRQHPRQRLRLRQLLAGRHAVAPGLCQAFAAGADGYVRSEGGVVLVLKRLDAARRDGDRVHGLVRGDAASTRTAAPRASRCRRGAPRRRCCASLRGRRRRARRGRLRGGARHRHAGRRPDRGGRHRRGPGAAPLGAAADRLGQVQHRPHRAGRRPRRRAEGHAGAGARPAARLAPLRRAEPRHPLRRAQPRALRRGLPCRAARRGASRA